MNEFISDSLRDEVKILKAFEDLSDRRQKEFINAMENAEELCGSNFVCIHEKIKMFALFKLCELPFAHFLRQISHWLGKSAWYWHIPYAYKFFNDGRREKIDFLRKLKTTQRTKSNL